MEKSIEQDHVNTDQHFIESNETEVELQQDNTPWNQKVYNWISTQFDKQYATY